MHLSDFSYKFFVRSLFLFHFTIVKNLGKYYSPYLAWLLLDENEIRVLRPHFERLVQLGINFVLWQISRILANLVRQFLHTPSRTCNKVFLFYFFRFLYTYYHYIKNLILMYNYENYICKICIFNIIIM